METLDKTATTNRLLSAILILMTLAAIYFDKDIVLPIVLGFMLALTLGPFVRWLARRGVPSPISAVVLIGRFAVSAGIALLLLGGSVASWFDDIHRIAFEMRAKLRWVIESLAAVQDASSQVEDLTAGGEDTDETVVLQQPGLLTKAVSSAVSFPTSLAAGLILALFLLSAGNLFYVKVVESFPRFADKRRALTVIYQIEKSMSHYLLAITCINAALGVAISAAMYFRNCPACWVEEYC